MSDSGEAGAYCYSQSGWQVLFNAIQETQQLFSVLLHQWDLELSALWKACVSVQ